MQYQGNIQVGVISEQYIYLNASLKWSNFIQLGFDWITPHARKNHLSCWCGIIAEWRDCGATSSGSKCRPSFSASFLFLRRTWKPGLVSGIRTDWPKNCGEQQPIFLLIHFLPRSSSTFKSLAAGMRNKTLCELVYPLKLTSSELSNVLHAHASIKICT